MNGLDVLVDGIIDYAGMFPPAELSFENMLREAAHLGGTLRRPHLIGSDVVVRPEHLVGLEDDTLRVAGFTRDRRLRICVVGVPLEDGSAQVAAIQRFRRRAQQAGYRRRVVSLEVVLEDTISDDGDVDTIADRIATLQDAAAEENVALYIEPKWAEMAWKERFPRAVALFSRLNESGGDLPVGLKVRCAGPTALGAAMLARIVPLVNELDIPFKTTQGLHHPVVEPERYGNPVGFVGLAAALRLHEIREDGMDAAALAGCIAEHDADTFSFDDGLAWREHHIDAAELERAMGHTFSVGSCSAREPDDDLVRLFGAPPSR